MATRPSLEELLEGVPINKLDKPCKDVHLCEIALSVTNWKSITPFLGISVAVEEEIEKDEGKTRTQRIAMLRKWKELYGRKATYRKLATVFWKLERADLVDEVASVLADSESSSSDEEEVLTHRNILDQYAAHLRSKYPKEIPSFTQWPPSPTRKFFNLAMIHRHRISQGPIDEKYIRLIQRGNVDDIMLNKTAIKLKDIFRSALQVSLGSKNRMIILVEGAPGAGKSTLAWYICEQWGSGILFGDFKLVVFVQLRSLAVQNATSIADILPRMANGKEREVLTQLETRRGKDVLFVLDGWDEYSGGLKQDGICGKLICSPADLSMQESTLLITSRPVASGELQQLCSARVEIVGFTQTEVESYFREVLTRASQEEQAEVLQECLKVRPVIQASCYLPLNAAIVIHLFITEQNALPTTLHGLFTSLVLNCIVRHMRKLKAGLVMPKMTCFDDIPTELLPQFNAICTVAFHGIKSNKASFSEEEVRSLDIPTSTSQPLLSLIQGWSTFRSAWQEKSYSFFHLSVQELLAAFHISKRPASEQVQEIRNLFGQPRFAAVLHYYAAFTKFQVHGIREFLKEVIQGGGSESNERSQFHSYTIESSPGNRNIFKSILDSLYEAQDPSLCQYIATLLQEKLIVDYRVSPLDCMVLGYFLHCLCFTPGGGNFHIELATPDFDEYNCSYLIDELKKCTNGQLALSLGERGNKGGLSIIVPMLQESCSHCVSGLSLSLDEESFGVALLKTHYEIPVVSLSIVGTGQRSSIQPPSLLPVHQQSQLFTRQHSLHSGSPLRFRSLSYGSLSSTLSDIMKLQSQQYQEFKVRLQSLSPHAIKPEPPPQLRLRSPDSQSQHNYKLRPVSLQRPRRSTNRRSSRRTPLVSWIPEMPQIQHYVQQPLRTLMNSLNKNAAVETLRLSKIHFTGNTLAALAHSLVNNVTLKSLNLSDCTVSPEGMLGLADYLAKASALETLSLSGCRLRIVKGMQVPTKSSMEELDLDSTLAQQKGALTKFHHETLTQAIKAPKAVRPDWITPTVASKTPDMGPSVQALAVSLAGNRTLKCLNLSKCLFGRELVPHLPLALTRNKTLETLVLSYSWLTNADLISIADALRLNSGLMMLDISRCMVGCNDPEALTLLLTASQSLQTLILSYNNLSFAHGQCLAQGLGENKSLRSLSITHCRLADQTMEVIVEALEHNPVLQEIDFTGNHLTENGLHTLNERLQMIPSLQKMTPTSQETDPEF